MFTATLLVKALSHCRFDKFEAGQRSSDREKQVVADGTHSSEERALARRQADIFVKLH
jgi:hypothetical protein